MKSIRVGIIVLATLFVAVITLQTTAQAHKSQAKSRPPANSFSGHWTYRSFRNDPTPVGDAEKDPSKLIKLLFAEGELVLDNTTDGSVKGTLQFDATSVMDLTGEITPAHAGAPARIHINGKGRPGTPTEMYFYDYDGVLAYHWPDGVNQTPAIVGSVIRVKPHDGAPAGYVASFIAVKHD
jgi:hypothetical protein